MNILLEYQGFVTVREYCEIALQDMQLGNSETRDSDERYFENTLISVHLYNDISTFKTMS